MLPVLSSTRETGRILHAFIVLTLVIMIFFISKYHTVPVRVLTILVDPGKSKFFS